MREYVAGTPRKQSLADLFEGEWATKFPDEVGITAGESPLFEDGRIPWIIEQVGGVEGMRILELGPLDGAHTAMLLAAGADEVVGVEANVRAYLRCLATKELLDLDGARFVLGEIGAYVEGAAAAWNGDGPVPVPGADIPGGPVELPGSSAPRTSHGHERRPGSDIPGGPAFDLVLASGVLYHLLEPADLLLGLGALADRVFVWTHHFDRAAIEEHNQTGLLDRVTTSAQKVLPDDSTVTYHQHGYELGAIQKSFCGGPADASNWMELAGLHQVMELAGLRLRVEAFDHRDHPNGPAIGILASAPTPRRADRSRPAPRWGLVSSQDPEGRQVDAVPDGASFQRAVSREGELVAKITQLEAYLARRHPKTMVRRAIHPWLQGR